MTIITNVCLQVPADFTISTTQEDGSATKAYTIGDGLYLQVISLRNSTFVPNSQIIAPNNILVATNFYKIITFITQIY